MLVLAMEFSRCARRSDHTAAPVRDRFGGVRAAGGRRTAGTAREVDSGALTADDVLPGDRATPSKRNSDARWQPQGLQPHERDATKERRAARQGQGMDDSE